MIHVKVSRSIRWRLQISVAYCTITLSNRYRYTVPFQYGSVSYRYNAVEYHPDSVVFMDRLGTRLGQARINPISAVLERERDRTNTEYSTGTGPSRLHYRNRIVNFWVCTDLVTNHTTDSVSTGKEVLYKLLANGAKFNLVLLID